MMSSAVKVDGGATIEARAGESLMLALEKKGVLIPSICRSGECSMCRVKILSGRVFQPAGVPVRKSDAQFGYVHSCVLFLLKILKFCYKVTMSLMATTLERSP